MKAALIATFLVSVFLYVRGSSGFRWWEKLSYALAWATLLIALLSPLDRWSDILFSAHMTQHELLILVAAPLLVIARPLVALLHAFDPPLKLRLGPLTGVWRALSHPLVAVALHGVTVWAWHAPFLFEAAMRNEAVHAIQHMMFFGTAVIFWWALVHGRYGRMGYGVSVLFVFVTAMHTGLLGVLFTFARTPLYAPYPSLEDQQLAGVLMWVPSGILFMILGLALFGAWLGRMEGAPHGANAPESRPET